MVDGRPLVWATVLIVLLAAVASGPLVGAVDLTGAQAHPGPPAGTGAATVDVVSVPSVVTLQRSAFGAGTFHLEAPPARVRVRSVSGNPTLRYTIDIPGLWFSDAKTYALRDRAGDRLDLTFRPVELSPTRVENGSYHGRLAIWLVVDGGTYRTVYQEPVTVEVER